MDFQVVSRRRQPYSIQDWNCASSHIFVNNKLSERQQRPLPPGPRLSFLNTKCLHRIYPWRAFQKWHKIYGSILSMQFGQRVMISIGSYEVAHDLLEKWKDLGPVLSSAESVSLKGFIQHCFHPQVPTPWKTHRRLALNFLSNRQTRSYSLSLPAGSWDQTICLQLQDQMIFGRVPRAFTAGSGRDKAELWSSKLVATSSWRLHKMHMKRSDILLLILRRLHRICITVRLVYSTDQSRPFSRHCHHLSRTIFNYFGSPTRTMSPKTFFDHQKLMREMMLSQKYTDLVLCCQGKEFKVHKAIVCTQSPVLAAACDGGFKV